ncbi:MAG TPA: hypothetical protein EYP56_21880 [Planctomycetaceae bacterium]|nr:hypothetical protein [Planctomycetaceae bacterium]HIQ20687.1 hypothetical protein [Planctomycetota bacterium]
MRYCRLLVVLICAAWAGCGTSKWTDTKRSATEQLLISDSMDRAVSRLNFRALAGKTVYLDATPLKGYTDTSYLISLLRQHMLASGCLLRDTKAAAEYVVEARVGAVGTDRHEVMFGIPAVNIPSVIPVTGIPSRIPEMPLVKKTDCRAVTKLAVFAYNQKTGQPVWQSGTVPVESTAKDIWVLGAGPFQRGTIYEGTNFAGDEINIKIPLIDLNKKERDRVAVCDEAYFVELAGQQVASKDAGQSRKPGAKASAKGSKSKQSDAPVVRASHEGASKRSPAESTPEDKPQENKPQEPKKQSGDPQREKPPAGQPPAEAQKPSTSSPQAPDPPKPLPAPPAGAGRTDAAAQNDLYPWWARPVRPVSATQLRWP